MVSSNKMTSREESVYHQLNKTALLERVRELMRVRLMECGWRDQVRLECRKILNENSTEDTMVSVNDLVKLVTPQARSLVPDSVKRELLRELESSLVDMSQINSNYSNKL